MDFLYDIYSFNNTDCIESFKRHDLNGLEFDEYYMSVDVLYKIDRLNLTKYFSNIFSFDEAICVYTPLGNIAKIFIKDFDLFYDFVFNQAALVKYKDIIVEHFSEYFSDEKTKKYSDKILYTLIYNDNNAIYSVHLNHSISDTDLSVTINEGCTKFIYHKKLQRLIENFTTNTVHNIYIQVNCHNKLDLSEAFKNFKLSEFEPFELELESENDIEIGCRSMFEEGNLKDIRISKKFIITDAVNMFNGCRKLKRCDIRGSFKSESTFGMFESCTSLSVVACNYKGLFDYTRNVDYMFSGVESLSLGDINYDFKNIKNYHNFICTVNDNIDINFCSNIMNPRSFLKSVANIISVSLNNLKKVFPTLDFKEMKELLDEYVSNHSIILTDDSGHILNYDELDFIDLSLALDKKLE